MAQKAILVVGSLNMDQVVRLPRLPSLGETLLSTSSVKLVPGGKGANQAVAMARLGASVRMAGRIGNDPFAQQLLQALQNDEIDTSLVATDPDEASGVAFILLSTEGDNAIVVASGANARVGQDAAQLAEIEEALTLASTLVMQLEIPTETVQRLIHKAHELHVPVVLNLAPAQALPLELLRLLSVLIVNESEASQLTGQRIDSLEDARFVATMLYKQGISTVVVTLGAQGALLVTNDPAGNILTLHQPSPKVSVVDTTAAGDCFVGALTVALNEGQSPEEALRFAVYASAVKVTRFGAQSGLPAREDVLAAYYSGH